MVTRHQTLNSSYGYQSRATECHPSCKIYHEDLKQKKLHCWFIHFLQSVQYNCNELNYTEIFQISVQLSRLVHS